MNRPLCTVRRPLAIALLVASLSCQTKPTLPLDGSYNLNTEDAETMAAQAVQTRLAGRLVVGALGALIPRNSRGGYSYGNMPQNWPWPRGISPYDDEKYAAENAQYRPRFKGSTHSPHSLLRSAKEFNNKIAAFLASQQRTKEVIEKENDLQTRISAANEAAAESKRVLHIIEKRLSLRGKMLFMQDWSHSYFAKSSYRDLRDELQQMKTRVLAKGKEFQAIARANP